MPIRACKHTGIGIDEGSAAALLVRPHLRVCHRPICAGGAAPVVTTDAVDVTAHRSAAIRYSIDRYWAP